MEIASSDRDAEFALSQFYRISVDNGERIAGIWLRVVPGAVGYGAVELLEN